MGVGVSTPQAENLKELDRGALLALLQEETHAQNALTTLLHEAIAARLGLHPTDQKCLDLIWQSTMIKAAGPMTPGHLAKLTQLTTGAITGVLDRLEAAGYVKREHDPDDRRRVIIVAVPEHIKRDLGPVFQCMTETFEQRCRTYSDEELRLLIDFARCSQSILRDATAQVKALEHTSA